MQPKCRNYSLRDEHWFSFADDRVHHNVTVDEVSKRF